MYVLLIASYLSACLSIYLSHRCMCLTLSCHVCETCLCLGRQHYLCLCAFLQHLSWSWSFRTGAPLELTGLCFSKKKYFESPSVAHGALVQEGGKRTKTTAFSTVRAKSYIGNELGRSIWQSCYRHIPKLSLPIGTELTFGFHPPPPLSSFPAFWTKFLIK